MRISSMTASVSLRVRVAEANFAASTYTPGPAGQTDPPAHPLRVALTAPVLDAGLDV
jgi:hypothetical protein